MKNGVKDLKNSRKKNQGGFTTVELIVTVVLVMILAGGLVAGIMKWVEWTNFKRQNEYARTLFVAAQNQLTEYSVGGRLKDLQEAIDGGNAQNTGIVPLDTLKSPDGLPYKTDELWPESKDKNNESLYQEDIRYLIGTEADYKAYQNGTAGPDVEALYELLIPYVYDPAILNATICVEFTPENGQVFSVLYSDVSKGFIYQDEDDTSGSAVDISDRTAKERKKHMIGYYGVDTLSKATNKPEKPSITAVRLNNEDTLNLSFRLDKVEQAAQQLTYKINVYDKTTKKVVLIITLDGTEIKTKDFEKEISCNVIRYSYDSNGNVIKQEIGPYDILAWIDRDSTIRVVLDAADLEATSALYEEVYDDLVDTDTNDSITVRNGLVDDFRQTYSFRRFGVDVDDIYCTIQGYGAYYKDTAKKKSNTEHAYFGAAQIEQMTEENEELTSGIYAIKNARHLYNIRYMEDYTEREREIQEGLQTPDQVTYRLTQDISWAEFVKNESLFQSGEIVIETKQTDDKKDTDFPSVKQLRQNSTFAGNEHKRYSMEGLTISRGSNEVAELYAANQGNGNQPEDYSVGLFLVNYGTIRDMTLDQISVIGFYTKKTGDTVTKQNTNNVGGFCGENYGILENLTVDSTDKQNKSVISGANNVGGIAGAQEKNNAKSTTYSGLVNRASVSGVKNVGGIAGSLMANGGHSVLVENCKNYGQVEADQTVSATEPEHIGGIVGYGYASGNGNKESLMIQTCTSSPQYTDSEINTLTENESFLEDKLKGIYVGGIIGYNNGGSIRDCNTEKESASKEGYIFGYQYVGGIVGGSGKQAKEIDGITSNGKAGVSAVNVIGSTYVGGITGIVESRQSQTADSYAESVSNWVNKGAVIARQNYAGGIVGYNTGDILNCSSDVENNKSVKDLTASLSLKGSYAGGIAGYNNGTITSSELQSIVCYVSGKHFVGGIVGYNDADSEVSGYAVAGGYIKGAGSFIGGYVGMNTAAELLAGNRLISSPNEISGDYFVGGIIGGNMVATSAEQLDTIMYTDNFLGTLKAYEAFAGGFIGYIKLVSSGVNKNEIKGEAETLADHLEQVTEATGEEENPLEEAVEMVSNWGSAMPGSDTQLFVSGGNEGSQSRFGNLSAKIYAGGVIGYNDAETNLYIENITNLTPVTAEEAILNEHEQDNRPGFSYSYVGGIIGKVTKKVTLDGCGNQGVGDVTSSGTYLGGLTEINEGKIKNCYVSSLGSITSNYVGGITGLNKPEADIENCAFRERPVTTITGSHYVGGIAAENFGRISVSDMKYGIINGNSQVGGIAGFAVSGSTIELMGNIQVNITASGNDIGGLVGLNETSIEKLSTSVPDIIGALSKWDITGSITGNKNVGGVVGRSLAGDIRGFHNQAAVQAKEGEAGGIVGSDDSTSEMKIEDCLNSGGVYALNSGNAGGMIGNNKGIIQNCVNRGSVSAVNGICGGITGTNTDTIENSSVAIDNTDGLALSLTFTGKTNAGGICGINSGTVRNSSVSADAGLITITNLSDSRKSALGGITGINENSGSIEVCELGEKTKIMLKSNAADVSMGGVAGMNRGSITGKETGYSVVNAGLSFSQTNQAYYGNLGGVAGSNTGVISHYEFNGEVAGTANNPQLSPEYNPNTDTETNGAVIYGYGGIAGVNGAGSAMGTIVHCKVFTAKITGLGDPNNIANIGGIAGVNGIGSSISDVTFGTAEEYQVLKANDHTLPDIKTATASVYVGTENGNASYYAHSGGVAGMNSGHIWGIDLDIEPETGLHADDGDDTRVIVENYSGHVGGITGYNRRTGTINQVTTGKNWIIFAPQNAQDNGCGGIVGYQAYDGEMADCVNRATVEKTAANSNAVGGIVGRLETATSSNLNIARCVNYGTIQAANRAGGIVGVWKYYGGTISDSKNYGTIHTDGSILGGIVGQLYRLNTTAANIVRCENHGSITGNQAGGIVGTNSDEVYFRIEKCVNTGVITANDANGGIAGKITGAKAGSAIISCNNYGVGSDNGSLNGVLANGSSGNIKVSKCFGVADSSIPISNSSGTEGNNYYFVDSGPESGLNYYIAENGVIKDSQTPADAFYVQKIEAAGAGLENAGNLEQVVWDINNDPGNRTFFRNQKTDVSCTYYFKFSTAIDLSGIDLYWNRNGNDQRMFDYTVSYSPYTEEKGWQEYTVVKRATNGDFTSVNKETVTGSEPVKARSVKIEVTKSVNKNGVGAHVCLIKAYFNGTVFDRIKYEGENGYLQKTESGFRPVPYEDQAAGSLKWNTKAGTFEGLVYEETTTASSVTNGKGTPSNITPAGVNGTYKVTLELGAVTVGLPGFPINPLTVYSNKQNLTDTGLTATGSSTDNIRYQVFEADNPYFDVDASEHVTVVEIPKNIKFQNDENASYNVAWDQIGNASFYEYTVSFLDQSGRELKKEEDISYDHATNISVSDIDGTVVDKIVFKVRACVDTIDTAGNLHVVKSEYSQEASYNVPPILPVPQYHLELVRKNINNVETLVYRAFLDNQNEYRTFLESEGLQEPELSAALAKIRIHISESNLSFHALEAQTAENYYSGMNSNKMYWAYASYEENGVYTSSLNPMRESQAPAHGLYTDTSKIADVKLKPSAADNIGFQGTTADTLSYQLKIGCLNQQILYMRSELIATDNSLGVPVAVSTSQFRTSDTTSSAVAATLGSLPVELLDETAFTDLTVRSYPTVMSNNIVYTGHTVNIAGVKGNSKAIGLTKDQLESLYVTEDHQVTSVPGPEKLLRETGGKKALSDGFVIELATDGSYTLYFNALLEYNEAVPTVNHEEAQEGSQIMRTQVFSYKLSDPRTTVPHPIIHVIEENGADGDPNEDTMVITWDLKKTGYQNSGTYNYKKGAVYDYVITGYTSDEKAVQIMNGTYVTGPDGDGENILKCDTTAWNYQKVKVAISRRGETVQGMTSVFPAGTIETYELKLRFSQVTRPNIELHREGDEIQKNSLIYDISWASIPENEEEELAAYEILAERSGNDVKATASYDQEADFHTAIEKAETLYQNKIKKFGGSEIKDTNRIRYTWQEKQVEDQDVTVTKTMLLEWNMTQSGESRDVNWSISKTLTEVWVFPVLLEDRLLAEYVKVLDLNDYERGESVELSVRALAAQGEHVSYRDGVKGVVREMTIPERLDVPDVTELDHTPKYHAHDEAGLPASEQTYMTAEAFADGVTLMLQPANESGVLQGRYEIAVAVYDEIQEEVFDTIPNTGDAVDVNEPGYWNSGAYRTLLAKSDVTKMDGNLLSASYPLKLDSTSYAGKWLKIALRSISDSNVSSYWSDEDDTTDQTVSYKWVQIPRMQVETPDLTESTSVLFYDSDGLWLGDPTQSDKTNANEYKVQQNSLIFNEVEHTDHYQLQLIRQAKEEKAIDPDKTYAIYDTDWIYAEHAGKGMYHIFFATTDPEFHAEAYQDPANPVSELDDSAVYLATVDRDHSFVSLPYVKEAAGSAAEDAQKVQLTSFIRYIAEEDSSQWMLVFPDALDLEGDVDASNLFTAQVSVQAKIALANVPRYEDSQVTDWYRRTSGDPNIITFPEYMDPPNVSALDFSASERENTAYEIHATALHWLIYQVSVLNPDDSTVYNGYVSSYGYGISDIANVTLLPDVKFAVLAGKKLQVRIAAVVNGSSESGIGQGGLSKWTDWITLGELPELKVEAPDVTVKDTQMNAGLTSSDGQVNVTKSIDGLAYTWSWQKKAVGYEIKIGDAAYYIAESEAGTYRLAEVSAQSVPQTGEVETEVFQLSATAALDVAVIEDNVIYTVTLPRQDCVVNQSEQELKFSFDVKPEIKAVPFNDCYQSDSFYGS